MLSFAMKKITESYVLRTSNNFKKAITLNLSYVVGEFNSVEHCTKLVSLDDASFNFIGIINLYYNTILLFILGLVFILIYLLFHLIKPKFFLLLFKLKKTVMFMYKYLFVNTFKLMCYFFLLLFLSYLLYYYLAVILIGLFYFFDVGLILIENWLNCLFDQFNWKATCDPGLTDPKLPSSESSLNNDVVSTESNVNDSKNFNMAVLISYKKQFVNKSVNFNAMYVLYPKDTALFNDHGAGDFFTGFSYDQGDAIKKLRYFESKAWMEKHYPAEVGDAPSVHITNHIVNVSNIAPKPVVMPKSWFNPDMREIAVGAVSILVATSIIQSPQIKVYLSQQAKIITLKDLMYFNFSKFCSWFKK